MQPDRIRMDIANLTRQPWAMEQTRLQALFATLADAAPAGERAREPRGERSDSARDPREYALLGETAVIPITGIILKEVPEWFDWAGIAATGTTETLLRLGMAAADPRVKRISLLIDSPGGTVSGVADLADAIHDLRAEVPIVAVVEDLCASAAYWIGSQAEGITAGQTSIVGSIGVYCAHMDLTGYYKNFGIEIEVFRTGPLKGAGAYGTSLTKEQRADIQAEVDQLCEMFIQSVARGRGVAIETAREWATGGCWIGEAAMKAGLIDQVITTTAALAALSA